MRHQGLLVALLTLLALYGLGSYWMLSTPVQLAVALPSGLPVDDELWPPFSDFSLSEWRVLNDDAWYWSSEWDPLITPNVMGAGMRTPGWAEPQVSPSALKLAAEPTGCMQGERKRPQRVAGLPRVALASYPRSGSTWTRSVLQHASGIIAGSIHPDDRAPYDDLKRSGTDGVLVIKTHLPDDHFVSSVTGRWHAYDMAILLVRNPFDAIWSHLNKQATYRFADSAANLKVPESILSAAGMLATWKAHLEYWTRVMARGDIPVMVVRYEDMVRDPQLQFLRMSSFLGNDIDMHRLLCAVDDSSCEKSPNMCRAGAIGTGFESLRDLSSAFPGILPLDRMVASVQHLLRGFGYRVTDTQLEVLKRADLGGREGWQ